MPDYSQSRFPNPRQVPGNEPAAMGGNLSVDWLLDAYARGYFPWYGEEQPILWWCPDPRFVLVPEELKVSKALAKELKKEEWTVTFDTSFEKVIEACSSVKRPEQEGTWILDEIKAAYVKLHKEGYAHSVETWFEGELVGGLYGVSLGAVFFGESMFHTKSSASKVAFVHLVERLKVWGIGMIDCQQPTRYLESFGATNWSRDRFLKTLSLALRKNTFRGDWGSME